MKRTRRWLPLAFAPLLALGIPWYWPASDRALVLGVPAWVAAAIAASLAASILTAVLLARPWLGEDDVPPGEEESGEDD